MFCIYLYLWKRGLFMVPYNNVKSLILSEPNNFEDRSRCFSLKNNSKYFVNKT